MKSGLHRATRLAEGTNENIVNKGASQLVKGSNPRGWAHEHPARGSGPEHAQGAAAVRAARGGGRSAGQRSVFCRTQCFRVLS